MRKGDPTNFPLNICKGGICLFSRNSLLRRSSIFIIFRWESPKFPKYPFPLETFPPVLCRATHEKQYVQTILPYQTQTYPPRPASSKSLRKWQAQTHWKTHSTLYVSANSLKKHGRNIPGSFGSTFLYIFGPQRNSPGSIAFACQLYHPYQSLYSSLGSLEAGSHSKKPQDGPTKTSYRVK